MKPSETKIESRKVLEEKEISSTPVGEKVKSKVVEKKVKRPYLVEYPIGEVSETSLRTACEKVCDGLQSLLRQGLVPQAHLTFCHGHGPAVVNGELIPANRERWLLFKDWEVLRKYLDLPPFGTVLGSNRAEYEAVCALMQKLDSPGLRKRVSLYYDFHLTPLALKRLTGPFQIKFGEETQTFVSLSQSEFERQCQRNSVKRAALVKYRSPLLLAKVFHFPTRHHYFGKGASISLSSYVHGSLEVHPNVAGVKL